MIRELSIRNFALIEELSLEFDKGFSVFTGETGAGKSILVGAISLLLGERASIEQIRMGSDEAEVSGVFEVRPPRPGIKALLDDLAIDLTDDRLVIRRKVSRSDRNRILVNETPITLASLKRLGDLLVDLHGQHEHQSLLNEETHGSVIDDLPWVADIKNEYAAAYHAYDSTRSVCAAFAARAAALAERREVLDFQYQEIAALSLRSGEEKELETELRLLSSSAERSAAASDILSLLASSEDSIEKRISAVRKKLDVLTRYDPSAAPWIADVGNALSVFTELETFTASYLDRIGGGADPSRIEYLNSRLAKIQRLKKKHSCDHDGLIARAESLRENLDAIGNADADRAELEKNLRNTLAACMKTGKELGRARAKAARDFDREITRIMQDLGFLKGCWKTVYASCAEPGPNGLELARFMVQTNPGEPLLPLSKTASGGEISRLMLAIKTVMSTHDRIPVLIFDEIDTGIGGMLAGNVARSLLGLSKTHQVLCISHLHQIAGAADRHYHVYKEVSGERTVTRVIRLKESERVEEIARMLGGDSSIALRHARELLRST
ncbi:MAG: DNA repair protein RecN [Chitinispirillaceae bacterium]|nr:DNA repair protein RecN [Chitinispirillaceae bacterium]